MPNDASLRVRLGEALAAAGVPEEAAQQLGDAIKLNPKHTGAYLDLGLVAVDQKQYGQAEGYFKKVVDLTEGAEFSNVNTHRENALYYLGQLMMQEKRYEDAAKYFKGALRIKRDSSDTLFQLAMAYKALGEYDQALKQLEIATAYDPGYAQAHYEMGQLLVEKKKDPVNGSAQLAMAAKYAPEADPVREALSALGTGAEWKAKADKAVADGDLNAAIDDVLVARNLEPKDGALAKLHAQLAERKGDKKAALAIYKEAAKLAPNDTEIKAAVARLSPKK
jgi:tetratricopeptide (TPR) repeat protein